ncbi:glycosyltransferase [Flavobacteriaceae bacterium S356]|uniref:Glycosyltransferase n=1 Tax=Asprobacillus argus TaxID=3076534 RepID=A0ABU3LFH9_9FLAO|nr:glycosyltransferase [Flavobacteriaceae bacterium S356]
MSKLKQDTPLISVIIPCYNTAEYVEDTIASLLEQSYANWEAILVNDASPDNILAIIEPYEKKDKRFTIINSKVNLGLSGARIEGIASSNGKYIFPLDSDDYVDANYFEKAIKILENDESIEVLYSDTMKFGAVNKVFELEEYSLPYLLRKNCIVASAFFRKSTYDRVGGYCDKLEFLEDWDLWISILKNGGKVHKINEPLFFYRVRETESLVNTMFNDMEKYREHHDIIFKRHTEAYLTHVGNPILIARELDNLKRQNSTKSVSFVKKIYKKFFRK